MLLRSGRRVATGEEAARAAVSRRRRSRARPDRLAGIPEEILQEILVRLPPKSVLRCRAVCRSWRRLASDPAFLLDHHRHQPELHLINSYRTVEGVDDWYPALEAVHLRGAEIRPVFGFPDIFHSPLTVDASCDGLFIAGNYICNPATRQWAPLSSNPKRRLGNLVGLYRHQPSGEYLVLYWTQAHVPFALQLLEGNMLCPNEYRVLTVGTDVQMSIFVLHDREQDVWAFQYRIKLPVMDIRRFQEEGDWCAKVVSEEGDVLVSCYGQLLHCDKGGNLVANFKFDDEIPVVIPHRLKESLIQHTFFQKKMKN